MGIISSFVDFTKKKKDDYVKQLEGVQKGTSFGGVSIKPTEPKVEPIKVEPIKFGGVNIPKSTFIPDIQDNYKIDLPTIKSGGGSWGEEDLDMSDRKKYMDELSFSKAFTKGDISDLEVPYNVAQDFVASGAVGGFGLSTLRGVSGLAKMFSEGAKGENTNQMSKDFTKWLDKNIKKIEANQRMLNVDVKYPLARDVGAAVGSVGGYMLGGGLLIGATHAGNVFEDTKDSGKSKARRVATSLASGAWQAGIEKIQMEFLASRMAAPFLSKTFGKAIVTGGTTWAGETLQELIQDTGSKVIEKTGVYGWEGGVKKNFDDLTEGWFQTAKVMFFVSGLPVTVSSMRGTPQYKKLNNQIKKDLKITSEKADKLTIEVLRHTRDGLNDLKSNIKGQVPAGFIPEKGKPKDLKDLIEAGKQAEEYITENKAKKNRTYQDITEERRQEEYVAPEAFDVKAIKSKEEAIQVQQEIQEDITRNELLIDNTTPFTSKDLDLFEEVRVFAVKNAEGDIASWAESNPIVSQAIERYNEATQQNLIDEEAFSLIEELPTNRELNNAIKENKALNTGLSNVKNLDFQKQIQESVGVRTKESKTEYQEFKNTMRKLSKEVNLAIKQTNLENKTKTQKVQGMQKHMTKLINKSKLSDSFKKRLLSNIKDMGTEKNANRVISKLIKDFKKFQKQDKTNILKDKISNELGKIKDKGGKVSVDILDKLNTLKDVSRSTLKNLKSVMNLDEVDMSDALSTSEENIDNYIKNKYIVGILNKDSKLLESVLEDVKFLISEGKEARNAEIAKKIEDINRGIGIFREVLGNKNFDENVVLTIKGKEVTMSLRNYYERVVHKIHSNTTLANNPIYAELLGDFLDRGTKSTQGKIYKEISVVDKELQYKKDVQGFSENINIELANIFGKKKWKKELKKMLNKKYYISEGGTFTTNKSKAYSDKGSHNLTISQWIEAYGLSKMGGELDNVQFTYGEKAPMILDKIMKENPKYEKFLNMTVKLYDSLYERKNEVFRRVNGYNIKKADNYLYAKKTYFNTKEGETYSRGSASLGSAKDKVESQTILKPSGIYETLMEQSEEINWYINSKEKYNQIQTIIHSKEVASYLETRLGKTGTKILTKFKNRLKRLANRETIKSSVKIDALNKAIAIYSRNRIIGKSKSFLTQIGSITTDWTEIGTLKYPIRKAEAIKDFITGKAEKELKELDRLVSTRDTLQAETLMKLKNNIPLIKELQNKLAYFIKTADKAAIAGSQYPLYLEYKAQLKKTTNLPLADIRVQAMLMAEERSSMTQQTDLQSLKADFQMTDNSFMNVFKIFTSSQVQFAQQTKASQINLLLANKNFARETRNIVMFRFIQPMLYTYITSGFIKFWGDDDEAKKAKNEILASMIMGNVSAFPYAGNLLDYLGRSVFNKFVEEDIQQFTPDSALDKLTQTVDKIITGDVKFEGSKSLRDYWALRAAGDILDWMSPVPVSTSINYLSPLIKPEIKKNMDTFTKIKLAMGYSPYTLGLDMSVKKKTRLDRIKNKSSSSNSNINF